MYIITKCGNCKESWQFLAPAGSAIVGSPIVKCKHCHALNKTSRQLYRDINLFERILFWGGTSLSAILYGLGGLAFGIGFVFVTDIGAIGKVFGVLGFVFGGINLYALANTKKSLKQLEETFDKNGGFIWSDSDL